MKILLIAIILLTIGSAHATDSWDKTDKALGATALALTLVDMGQTISIAKSCRVGGSGAYYEENSILGECPSVGRVRNYFAGSIVISGLIADVLPPKYRKEFLLSAAVVELYVVNRNAELHVTWSWK